MTHIQRGRSVMAGLVFVSLACDVQEEHGSCDMGLGSNPLGLSWNYAGYEIPMPPTTDRTRSLDCSVVAVASGTLEMLCSDGTVSDFTQKLSWSSMPDGLAEEMQTDTVEVRHQATFLDGGAVYGWTTARNAEDGTLLFVWVDGAALPPSEVVAPLQIELVDDVCSTKKTVCGTARILALKFTDSGNESTIIGRSEGQVGDFSVRVGAAGRATFTNFTMCSDGSHGDLFRFVAARTI